MKKHNILTRFKDLALLPLFLFAFLFTAASCSDDDPISTAGPDDNPMIISPVFPDRNDDGSLPTISSIYRDSAFVYNVVVTPHDYSTVSWNIDGQEVAQGDSINIQLPAGTYDLKIVVTTVQGKSTSREGLIEVKPEDADPYSSANGVERIVAPNEPAKLYGKNLSGIKSVIIGGQTAQATYNESDNTLSYTVPSGLADGTYRVLLVDADGNQYGANTVTVTSKVLITSGADRFGSEAVVAITGVNLDKVASLTIDGNTITDFTNRTSTSFTFKAPAMKLGEYIMTGKTTDGSDVEFYTLNGNTTSLLTTITEEITLWQGHQYVSWETADGDPNHAFTGLQNGFSNIKANTTLKVYYSIEPGASYHQLQITDGWWGKLPSTLGKTVETDAYDLSDGTYTLKQDGVIEVVLQQADLDAIRDHAGFLCVGHGYYVDRVATK